MTSVILLPEQNLRSTIVIHSDNLSGVKSTSFLSRTFSRNFEELDASLTAFRFLLTLGRYKRCVL